MMMFHHSDSFQVTSKGARNFPKSLRNSPRPLFFAQAGNGQGCVRKNLRFFWDPDQPYMSGTFGEGPEFLKKNT